MDRKGEVFRWNSVSQPFVGGDKYYQNITKATRLKIAKFDLGMCFSVIMSKYISISV